MFKIIHIEKTFRRRCIINKLQLGHTNLILSQIGLGGWQFANKGFSRYTWNKMQQNTINEIVLVAKNNNINWFDTAQMYGDGNSEKSLANALWNSQFTKPVIMTKWNPYFKTAKDISRSIEERIYCLTPYDIDVYQIHNTHSFSKIEQQMYEMAKLVRSSKVKHIGVSNFNAKQVRVAHKKLKECGYNLVSNQVRFNLLKRDIETNGVIETCRELGVSIICYSPLEKGLLTGKFHVYLNSIKTLPLLRRIKFNALIMKTHWLITELLVLANRHECSASNIAMAWIMNKHPDIFILSGVSNAKQIVDNVNSCNIVLSKDEIELLDKESSKIKLLYV